MTWVVPRSRARSIRGRAGNPARGRAWLYRGRAQDRNCPDGGRAARRRRPTGHAHQQGAGRCHPRRGRSRQVRDDSEVQGGGLRRAGQDRHPCGSERGVPYAVDWKRTARPRQRQAGDSNPATRRGVRRQPSRRRRGAQAELERGLCLRQLRQGRHRCQRSKIADLGVRTVRFANNVRLNIKKTDFEAGKVRFIVRLGDGLSTFRATNRVLGR